MKCTLENKDITNDTDEIWRRDNSIVNTNFDISFLGTFGILQSCPEKIQVRFTDSDQHSTKENWSSLGSLGFIVF